MDLVEILITKEILLLSAGIVAVIFGLGRIPISKQHNLRDNAWWRRFLPIVPLGLGIGGAFLPGVIGSEEPVAWGTKILAGLWAGFVAAHGRKIIKRMAIDKLDDRKQ